jgi:branched-subunit amino acid aminotransferase/4-amino-4-deoxychorismate lyase
VTEPACYTTGRFRAGRILLGDAVVARLVRDARALGLGELDPEHCRGELLALGQASFGADGEGIVRLEARPGGVLVGAARPLGPEPARWRAITAPVLHPGPGPAPGAKRAALPALARAREAAEGAGADEALLFDEAGRLVEGARTNLAVALVDGRFVMPPLARGAVRGVALEAALAAGVKLEERDLGRGQLSGVRELVALNAVRGARPIVALDGRRLGDGAPGPLHAALAAALAAAFLR